MRTEPFARPITLCLAAVTLAAANVVVWRGRPQISLLGWADSGVFETCWPMVAILAGASLFDFFVPLLLCRRRGRLKFERTIRTSTEGRERLEARLLELGYEVDRAGTFRPRRHGFALRALATDIARYPHRIELHPTATGAVVTFRYEVCVIDTGESEFARAVLDALEFGSTVRRLRTLHALATPAVWIGVAAALSGVLPVPLLGRMALSATAVIFGLLALVLVHFLRRRTYGRRFALMGIALGLLSGWMLF